MSWAKLDDGFYDHPKVLRAGFEATGLFCLALSYASRHSTDGALDGAVLEKLSNGRADLVAKLVDVGLFDAPESGVVIHDFLTYNPSSREVAKRRKQQRVRVSKFRKVKHASNALQPSNADALLRDGTGRDILSVSSASGKRDSTAPARDVLEFMNELSGLHFQPVAVTLDRINARLREYDSHTLAAMLRRQWAEWKGADMRKYFRPKTLFAAENCANYVGALSDLDHAWIAKQRQQAVAS